MTNTEFETWLHKTASNWTGPKGQQISFEAGGFAVRQLWLAEVQKLNDEIDALQCKEIQGILDD